MTSNHHAPYDLGYTRTTMVIKQREATQRCEAEPEKSSQFRLQAATRLHEVGIASNRGSACRGEYVPGPCPVTPWESVTPEVSSLTARRALPKVGLMTGVKS